MTMEVMVTVDGMVMEDTVEVMVTMATGHMDADAVILITVIAAGAVGFNSCTSEVVMLHWLGQREGESKASTCL